VTAKNVGGKAWKKEDMDALGTLNHEGIACAFLFLIFGRDKCKRLDKYALP
jgi:hypothetical protein